MQRIGMMLGVHADKLQEYLELHRNVWADVLTAMVECGIHNYTIFHRGQTLFATFEYHGKDLGADMARLAADTVTQHWWRLCEPCQFRLPEAKPGEWWARMDEVFHMD